jgi:peptidoglycan/xylan/chitin deacetylase (PgdA/CDA1 family)
MHDAADKKQTVETLPELIQYLKDEGYEFKTFYDIYK